MYYKGRRLQYETDSLELLAFDRRYDDSGFMRDIFPTGSDCGAMEQQWGERRS